MSIQSSPQPFPSPGPGGGCWLSSPQLLKVAGGKLCCGSAPRYRYLAPGRKDNLGPVTALGRGAWPAGLARPCHPVLRRHVEADTHTQPVFVPFGEGAPGMTHTYPRRYTCCLQSKGKRFPGHMRALHIHAHHLCFRCCAPQSLSPQPSWAAVISSQPRC